MIGKHRKNVSAKTSDIAYIPKHRAGGYIPRHAR